MTKDKKYNHILPYFFFFGGGGGNKAFRAEINIRQKKKSLLLHGKIFVLFVILFVHVLGRGFSNVVITCIQSLCLYTIKYVLIMEK